MKRVTIGASLITMDHLNFERDVRIAEDVGIDYLHIDVMDDHMVPRFGIYPEIIDQICAITKLPMDVHLMINKVEEFVRRYAHFKNIEYISFHADENQPNLFRIADLIRKFDKKPILVFNLSTNLNNYIEILNDEIWQGVMLMGIHPGVLDQTSRPDIVYKKLEVLHKKIVNTNVLNFIQVDGAVSIDTIPSLVGKGANNLICGSSSIYKNINFQQLSDQQLASQVKENFDVITGIINGN